MSKKKKQKVINFILTFLSEVKFTNDYVISGKVNVHWRTDFIDINMILKQMEERGLIIKKDGYIFCLTNKGKLLVDP